MVKGIVGIRRSYVTFDGQATMRHHGHGAAARRLGDGGAVFTGVRDTAVAHDIVGTIGHGGAPRRTQRDPRARDG